MIGLLDLRDLTVTSPLAPPRSTQNSSRPANALGTGPTASAYI